MSVLIIWIILYYPTTLPKNLKVLCQNRPPRTEPMLQRPSAINWIVRGRALEPHAIVGVHRPTSVTPLDVPLCHVDQKIVKTATSYKYFLALPYITVVTSIMKNAPSLLHNPKCALDILSHAL